MNKRLKDIIMDIGSRSHRVAYLLIKLSRKYNVRVVQANALTITHTHQQIEAFNEDVSDAVHGEGQYSILIGNFNAKTQFLLKKNLYAMNTFFLKKVLIENEHYGQLKLK